MGNGRDKGGATRRERRGQVGDGKKRMENFTGPFGVAQIVLIMLRSLDFIH